VAADHGQRAEVLRRPVGRYGVVFLLAALDYTGWAGRVPWLAAVFFVGGAGRAFSWALAAVTRRHRQEHRGSNPHVGGM
jgi:hypothetical protein